jgi:hypothetical protein
MSVLVEFDAARRGGVGLHDRVDSEGKSQGFKM